MAEPEPTPEPPKVNPFADTRPEIPPMWTYREVAAMCRVSLQTLQEWVKRGRVPSPTYIGFSARFTQEQVADIMCGRKKAGSYPVAPSPRAEIGKQGGHHAKKKNRPKPVHAKQPADKLANKKRASKPAVIKSKPVTKRTQTKPRR